MYRKGFDKEYGTCYLAEVAFLKSCGIRYSFVKDIEDTKWYKFQKNAELFHALSLFYQTTDTIKTHATELKKDGKDNNNGNKNCK